MVCRNTYRSQLETAAAAATQRNLNLLSADSYLPRWASFSKISPRHAAIVSRSTVHYCFESLFSSSEELSRRVSEKAHFRGGDFRDIGFRRTDFRGSDFRGTNFRGSGFRGTDFRGFDFRGFGFRVPRFRGFGVWDIGVRGTGFGVSVLNQNLHRFLQGCGCARGHER